MSRARSLLSSFALVTVQACAHGAEPNCPSTMAAAATEVARPDPTRLAWADQASIAAAAGPLALYDVRWLILTGESGAYASVPHTLHNFTLGRWECALGAEKASDQLSDGVASVQRQRRVVCTHPTGVVAQSDLSCAWRSPSPISAGSPADAKRELRLTLSDAPSVSVTCEPELKERLPIYQGEHQRTSEACVIAGRVDVCPPQH